MKIFKKIVPLALLLSTSTLYATTVNLEAYIKTSGTQPVNTTTQKVNDNIICPDGNDNSNSHYGCDMSHDTKFNNQGDTDPSNDLYESGNDMIVRTGDAFTLELTINANGGDVNEFTITSTLQSDVGLVWENLPSVCKSGSDITNDGLSMSCIRDNLASGSAEVIDFGVQVLDSALNMEIDLDAFTFNVSSEDIASDVSTTTDTQNSGDDDRLMITASPRWNIDIDRRLVENDYNNSGTMGYLVHLPFSLEEDRVLGTTDDINGYVGSENLGNDFTLDIKASISSTSSSNNAEVLTCLGEYTDYGSYPIGYYYDTDPQRSVGTPKDTTTILCSQDSLGGDIAINYQHIDATLNHIPSRTRSNNNLPIYQKFAAIGELPIFIPYDDLTVTDEHTDSDGDIYYEVNMTVSLTGFDPNSVSGTSNFNGDSESLEDNSISLNFIYYPDGKAGGEFSKTLNAVDGAVIRDSIHRNDGLGRVVAGGEFSTRLNWYNKGTKDYNDTRICDVIDANSYRITKFTGTDSPLKFIGGENNLEASEVEISYGVGYEGVWPPPLDQNNANAVLDECTGTSKTTWYDDFDTAVANGPITKIMIRTNELQKNKRLIVDVHNNAVARRIDGSLNHTETMMPNYTALYEDVLYANDDDHWVASEKILDPDNAGCHVPNNYLDQSADRVCLDMADVSVRQDLSTQNVEYGEEIQVSIHPRYTVDVEDEEIEDNVTLISVLSKGLNYQAGTSSVGEPTIGDCAMIDNSQTSMKNTCISNPEDFQILVWNFGIIKANDPIEDINYTLKIDVRAPEGYGNVYTQIEAPDTDHSTVSYRKISTSMLVVVPKKFYISKRVLTPFREIDQAPITFVTDVKNALDDPISKIDIIDILPFNGDGTDGFDLEDDKHHIRDKATNYHGTSVFDTVEALADCSSSVTWEYTNKNPREINISPKHSSNLEGGSTSWCAGDNNGPDSSCGYDKGEVTAVRLKYSGTLDSTQLCSLKLNLTPSNNEYGDIYTNNSGASCDEVSLTVMSNDVSAIVPTTGIGDYVWIDSNANGVQDADETGIEGITVKLLDADNGDSEVASMETDSNGGYRFTALQRGNYKIQVVLPSSGQYQLTEVDQGGDDIQDSDVDPDNDNKTIAKALGDNETYLDFDIGLIDTFVCLGDLVWEDSDKDGVYDLGERGLSSIDVELFKDGSSTGKTTTTDSNGNYKFCNLSTGSYAVKFTNLPNNYSFTTQNSVGATDETDSDVDPDTGMSESLTLDSDDNMTLDAGLITMPIVSGTIFNDPDAGVINGTPIATVETKQLYVNLLDDTGSVIANSAIDNNGTYQFGSSDGIEMDSSYSIVLSTTQNSTQSTLPDGWNSSDDSIAINVEKDNILNIDFGLNKRPVASNVNGGTQSNPGGDTQVVLPNPLVSDYEDGTPSTITVVTLPDNATLYYDQHVIVADTSIVDFNRSKFTIDPEDGNQSVRFLYTTTDKAGIISNEANITLLFSDITLSGTLFDDGNANGNVDGTIISSADTTDLYVVLLDDNGDRVSSKAFVDGNYLFSTTDGVESNEQYTLILSEDPNGVTPSIPNTWTHADGENIGLTGLDGTADGKITVTVNSSTIQEINFGINKRPEAENQTDMSKTNPGGDVQVAVEPLRIHDQEDSTLRIVTITELPNNGTLYYNGSRVTLNDEIEDVNISKFTIDPQDGDLTVSFKYTTTDRTGAVSDVATVEVSFTALQISGHVFNDENKDGIVNGTGIAAPNGVQLYVTLLDANQTLLASKEVNSDGSYGFGDRDGIVPDSNYTVVLTTQENNITAALPINWSNMDGEHIGVDAGTDGNSDGLILVPIATTNIVEVNFGINKKPVAGDNSSALQLNPGGTIQVDVPDLNITDNEDGTPPLVTIETVPSHGVLYYDGVVVTAGQEISNLDNTLLTLDPNNGDQVVSFTYTTTDSMGLESEVATISMSFKGLKISGNIFDDGNHDGTINGTAISLLDGLPLYVTLLDNNAQVMATMPIGVGGVYAFDGEDGIAPHTNYRVVLGIESNSSTPILPSNWKNQDGEHIGLSVGLDDMADGKIDVNITTVDVSEVNFGINQQPLANDLNETEQFNPGGDTKVTVPMLDISDREDGSYLMITIKSLPDNGTLFYDGRAVVVNQEIEDFNNSKLMVDPIDGEQLIVFDYTVTDSAGFESVVAKVRMPFGGIKISGNIFDDGNGNGLVDGIRVSQAGETPLFVNLLSEEGELIASYSLSNDSDHIGIYAFDGNDSVTANTNYKIILTTESNATTASLPVDWNNADGEYSPSECTEPVFTRKSIGNNISKLCGMDTLADGAIDIHVKTEDIINVNFGINERPTTKNVASSLVLNPNTRVQVIDLEASDREDGIPYIVTINTLPSGGTLYYDGVTVVADQNITDFNNSKLMVFPNNGNTAIVFTYSAIDSTGWHSTEPSRVRMPFYVPAPVVDDTPVTEQPIDLSTDEELEDSEPVADQEPTPEEEEDQMDEEPAVIFNLDIMDDSIEANTDGSTTTIPVLNNDEVQDGVHIHLVNFDEGEILWNNGTAVGGTSVNTTDSLVVEGEGTWRVVDGTITFTAEDGFDGIPTPIYYLVEDEQGNQSNVAEVSITSSCYCEPYVAKASDAVASFNGMGIFMLIFFTSLLSLFFREEELI